MNIVEKWTQSSLILKIIIGLINGVIEDLSKTALNLAGDGLFSVTAEYYERK